MKDHKIQTQAKKGATNVCKGMLLHDRSQFVEAKEKFAVADRILFQTDQDVAKESADAYTEALRQKDILENTVNRNMKRLQFADWRNVKSELERRQKCLEIEDSYAELVTEAWRNHKLNKDYWTPYMKAQKLLIQRAIRDSEYPHKESEGLSGFGPEPAIYIVAVELHDLHTDARFQQAIQVMTQYYTQVLQMRGIE